MSFEIRPYTGISLWILLIKICQPESDSVALILKSCFCLLLGYASFYFCFGFCFLFSFNQNRSPSSFYFCFSPLRIMWICGDLILCGVREVTTACRRRFKIRKKKRKVEVDVKSCKLYYLWLLETVVNDGHRRRDPVSFWLLFVLNWDVIKPSKTLFQQINWF